MALRHLNTRRIADVQIDEQTTNFKGFFYDEGDTLGTSSRTARRTARFDSHRFIKATDVIAGFHDDKNLYDNTYYSGMSVIWPILSVSQSDDVINDEDIPEITGNLGAKFGFVYAGTNDETKIAEITDLIADKGWLVHGNPELTAQVEDLGRDPMELPSVRNANAKYMCMCMNLPLFLLFEDRANFATANQTMQVYKQGVLKRYRTWLQGILEDYWYDLILADHLGIELQDVIAMPIKIKAIFPDINFGGIYIHNAHASLTMQNVRVYIQTNSTSTSTTWEIGLRSAALNATEQTVADENTAPSAVTFSAPTTYATGLVCPDISFGQHKSIWYKRIVNAASPAFNDDTTTIN